MEKAVFVGPLNMIGFGFFLLVRDRKPNPVTKDSLKYWAKRGLFVGIRQQSSEHFFKKKFSLLSIDTYNCIKIGHGRECKQLLSSFELQSYSSKNNLASIHAITFLPTQLFITT